MILALMRPTASYVLAQQSKVGAIVFHLELYDEVGRLLTSLGALSKPAELEVLAQVYAITPPDDPGVLKEVYRDRVRGLTLRLEARGALKDVAEGWVRFEEKRGPVTRDSGTAVQLNLWIVNKTSGEVVQRVSYYYTYSPKGILEGEERAYKVKIAVPKKAKGASGSEMEANIRVADGCLGYFEWRRVYTITPDTYVQAGGPPEVYDHLLRRDGTWYIRTPLLTIYNTHSPSPILASIWYGSEKYTWFYVAIGIDFEVERKLKNGDITGGLSGKVYLGGRSRDMRVSFGEILSNAQSWEEAYAWIWARPVYVFYHEYYVDCMGETYTGRDKVDFFVQDVVKTYDSQLKKYYIEGGVRRERLPSFIRDWIYNGTLTEYVYTYTLRPGEAILLGDFLEVYVDTCQADFKVPTGPVLAAAVRRVAPHLLPLAVTITPSISISWGESETGYVGGGLQNDGQYYEYLYIRQSKLSYRKDPPWWCLWCNPCYYKVPVSLFIESR
jgi:hypothetical protein